MPDIAFDTLELVPDGLREHAKSDGGKFVVKVVPQVRLDEFRQNNVTLSQERDTLKGTITSYEGLLGGKPLDEFKSELQLLRQVEQEVKDGKLSRSTDVETEVSKRVQNMRSDFERQVSEKSQEAANYRRQAQDAEQRFHGSLVDRAITDAVVDKRSGANQHALQDILLRAKNVFQLDSKGKLVAKDGEAVIYGADGATPMTPLEWLERLKGSAPYLFHSSSGGGAAGGGTGGAGAKNFGGYSEADFNKLPAIKRLELARKHNL